MTDNERGLADQFRKTLEDGDALQLWRMWFEIMPKFPQPKSLSEAEIIMHRARTEANSITFQKRAYSHSWLTERMLPSGLPDELRPKAEQLRPKIVEGVGIAVKFPVFLKEVGEAVELSMAEAVENCYADGDTDSVFVKARMFEARAKTIKLLLGK